MPSELREKWRVMREKLAELNFALELLEKAGGEPPTSYHLDQAHNDIVKALGLVTIERAQEEKP